MMDFNDTALAKASAYIEGFLFGREVRDGSIIALSMAVGIEMTLKHPEWGQAAFLEIPEHIRKLADVTCDRLLNVAPISTITRFSEEDDFEAHDVDRS